MSSRHPTEYQVQCLSQVKAVLEKHGFRPEFRWVGGELPRFEADISLDRGPHAIEIFSDSVVMTSGKQLFEAFLHKSFKRKYGDIDEFTERLNRYLEGGDWD